MAKLSSDGKYVTVERGDTLSEIARDYGKGTTYKQLAAINNISNPDRIYVGQKIYLTKNGASSSSSSANSNKPTINQFGEQSNAEGVLFATWTWSKDNTESYKVLWTYDTGGGVWFEGTNTTITVDKDAPEMSRQSVYNVPNNAVKVRFKVKPISKKKTTNGKETSYWEANWSDLKTWTDATPLETPAVPSVKIEKYKLTATLDNIDIDATGIEFEVVRDNAAKPSATGKATIVSAHASYTCTVAAGSEYKVRCRAYKGSNYSEWTDYSNNEGSAPSAPSGITTLKAVEKGVVYIAWGEVKSAETYDLEYSDKKAYLGSSNLTTTQSGIKEPNYTMSVDIGKEYFFRVRAVNSDGESEWCEPKSIILGDLPSAPTTWTLTTSVYIDNDDRSKVAKLYWTHNSTDGSSQTWAQIELKVGANPEILIEKKNPYIDDEENKDRIGEHEIRLADYPEGTRILWRVRTSGVLEKNWGDWSIQRALDIYAEPGLWMELMDANAKLISTVESFPFHLMVSPQPETQAPIGYNVTIYSNETYDTVDSIGNPKTITAGDEVYSRYYDVGENMLSIQFSAGDTDLENNITYTLKCTVAMDSGLTAENQLEFNVSWGDPEYTPNAEISIDMNNYTASIRPYCMQYKAKRNLVRKMGRTFTKTDDTVDFVYGQTVPNATVETGESVSQGIDADGNDIYYCDSVEAVYVDGITLAVYRREFDGRFTELASGITDHFTTVVDPHPSLDYARYRIVATSNATGAVSFTDLPGYPVGGKSVIIQWDEDWTNFEATEASALEQPPWSGSLLKLPYNIDVSDGSRPDVALIEYIGRSHPVSYYGTQVGTTSSWSTMIDKDDKETLYALRRLANWMGDVYVREPSGSGYWANLQVSFSQKHRDTTIPVSFSVTRVEGGI